ncbi:MAG TPA: nucleotidyltransferase domain-containing protein [Patescibacteria group bacterium]|nr:nucleotidyltransferase domain-containing protein [Patescibacteria group bacterium]
MLHHMQLQQIKEYFHTQPVEVVYLFGSQTEQETHPTSDVDIAILFQKGLEKNKRFDLKLEYIGQLSRILMTDFLDVVDLQDAPLLLSYSVITPRYILFVRDEQKRVEYEQYVLSRYLDNLYYIRRNTLTNLATVAQKGIFHE